jgi:hypothetical protein
VFTSFPDITLILVRSLSRFSFGFLSYLNAGVDCLGLRWSTLGRTIPSYRWKLEEEIASWKNMRDFLRIDERVLFDDMMDLARERASEAGAAVRPSILETMFMTLLFQHHRLIRRLEKTLKSHGLLLDRSLIHYSTGEDL